MIRHMDNRTELTEELCDYLIYSVHCLTEFRLLFAAGYNLRNEDQITKD